MLTPLLGWVARSTISVGAPPKPDLLGWGFCAERLVIFVFVKVQLKLVEGLARLRTDEFTL